jgi:hypothetical protein
MSPANYAIRANVESTVHAFKRPFSAGKLPVRGLIRAHMVACGSALVVNLRRLHHYFHTTEAATSSDSSFSSQTALFWRLVVTFIARFGRRTIVLSKSNVDLGNPATMAT